MTLLVRRRALLIFTVAVVLIILGVAIYSYLEVSAVAVGSRDAKVAAEGILFISIIGSGLALALGIVLVVRAVTLSAILDKLVNMNRMSGFSPELALDRLGEVGQKINQLYRQASDLSTKKSRKIGGLSSLLEHLMSISDKLSIVIDPAGKVVYASKSLMDRSERPRDMIIGKTLGELIPDADVSAAVQTIRRSRDPVVLSGQSGDLTLSPIFSPDGEIHYLASEVPRSVADEMRKARSPDPGKAASPEGRVSRRSLLPRLFGKRGRG